MTGNLLPQSPSRRYLHWTRLRPLQDQKLRSPPSSGGWVYFASYSGELNPISSPTESSGVADMGLPHLRDALVESPGLAAPVEVRAGPAAADGDMALSSCEPNNHQGNGSQLWSGECEGVGEGRVEAQERRWLPGSPRSDAVELREILYSKVLTWTVTL